MRPLTVGILTVSDKGFRKERTDLSGEVVRKLVCKEMGAQVIAHEIVPDEKEIIAQKIKEYVDQRKLDLIITTGGTGVSPRDVTPEATLEVVEKEVPGMAEAMRMEGLKKTPYSMISRAVVGIRQASIIINLPASPKACKENLLALLPALPHAVEKIKGDTSECGG